LATGLIETTEVERGMGDHVPSRGRQVGHLWKWLWNEGVVVVVFAVAPVMTANGNDASDRAVPEAFDVHS
jgi:hypothetical protein